MLYNLTIGDKDFKVAVSSAKDSLIKGLSGIPVLAKNKGLIFDFNKGEHKVTMNMFNMKFPIDMVFLNAGFKVIQVISVHPGETTLNVAGAAYVVEVPFRSIAVTAVDTTLEISEGLLALLNAGESEKDKALVIAGEAGISEELSNAYKEGGVIEISEKHVKADTSKMQVLDDKGAVLMNIQGGERIFSIEDTERMVALAKKVEAGEEPEEKLGKLLAVIIERHNTQKPQYTKII